jgi:hypothetical protein
MAFDQLPKGWKKRYARWQNEHRKPTQFKKARLAR